MQMLWDIWTTGLDWARRLKTKSDANTTVDHGVKLKQYNANRLTSDEYGNGVR